MVVDKYENSEGLHLLNKKSKILLRQLGQILKVNQIGDFILGLEKTSYEDKSKIIYVIRLQFKNNIGEYKDFVYSEIVVYPDKIINKAWKKQINKTFRYSILNYLCQLSFYKNNFIND